MIMIIWCILDLLALLICLDSWFAIFSASPSGPSSPDNHSYGLRFLFSALFILISNFAIPLVMG